MEKNRFGLEINEIKAHKKDITNVYAERFEVLEPYATTETGEILNATKFYKYLPKEPENIKEFVQSFKDQCDIYKLLEMVVRTDNLDLLNQNQNGMYIDISDIPINEIQAKNYLKESFNLSSKLETLQSDMQNKIQQTKIDNDKLIEKQNKQEELINLLLANLKKGETK